MTLKPTVAPAAVRAKGEVIACITTEDSEIYVNDRVEPLDTVRPGDTVDLVGYFEPENPRGQRLVVTFAFVRRNEPPPPPPLNTQANPEQQEK